jgi:hypothetical protein
VAVIALIQDLIFGSKITAEARAAGVQVRTARDPAGLAAADDGDLLLVDLNLPGAIEAAGAWVARTSRTAVGFVSHVDADTIARARVAGITPIPRSRFVNELPELLRRHHETQ